MVRTPHSYQLARIRIDELLREAEHERLLRQAAEGERPGAIDSRGFRERVSRLLDGFPPIGSGRRTPAGA